MNPVQPILTLTAKAAQKASEFLQKEQKKALRFDIKKSGCSGYMYAISLEHTPFEDDIVFEDKGVTIFVGKEGSSFLKGASVDFCSSLSESGFKIHNPNVKRTCGCGHSVG